MATMPITMSEAVICEGQMIGHAEARFEGGKGGQMVAHLSFRRNWPGYWHAMALMLDRESGSKNG